RAHPLERVGQVRPADRAGDRRAVRLQVLDDHGARRPPGRVPSQGHRREPRLRRVRPRRDVRGAGADGAGLRHGAAPHVHEAGHVHGALLRVLRDRARLDGRRVPGARMTVTTYEEASGLVVPEAAAGTVDIARVRALTLRYLVTSTILLGAGGLLGVLLRQSQADLDRISPNLWYEVMTAHGLAAFVGWARSHSWGSAGGSWPSAASRSRAGDGGSP